MAATGRTPATGRSRRPGAPAGRPAPAPPHPARRCSARTCPGAAGRRPDRPARRRTRRCRPAGLDGGLPHWDMFGRNIAVRGGVAPVRAYLPELMAEVLVGALDPSPVFDP